MRCILSSKQNLQALGFFSSKKKHQVYVNPLTYIILKNLMVCLGMDLETFFFMFRDHLKQILGSAGIAHSFFHSFLRIHHVT